MRTYLQDLRVLEGVEDIKPLSKDQKDLLIELFDDLQEAHDRMARVCGKLSTLAKGLIPKSTYVSDEIDNKAHDTIKYDCGIPGYTNWPDTCKKDVPQDRGERV